MPETAISKPLSPREAVMSVGRQVIKLIHEGACRNCAIRMVAKRYALTLEQVLVCLLDYEVADA